MCRLDIEPIKQLICRVEAGILGGADFSRRRPMSRGVVERQGGGRTQLVVGVLVAPILAPNVCVERPITADLRLTPLPRTSPPPPSFDAPSLRHEARAL